MHGCHDSSMRIVLRNHGVKDGPRLLAIRGGAMITLCSAAVAYLASVNDAVSDLVVGGLEDDNRVLAVVAAEVGPE